MRGYILKFIQQKKETYIAEVARKFGISSSCAFYHLNKLTIEGKIKRREFWENGYPAVGSYLICKDT